MDNLVKRIDLASVNWLLSGKAVVRLFARDYDMSTERYIKHVHDLAEACGINAEIREIAEPPGIVAQAYLKGGSAPKLRVPLIATSPVETPFLFCPEEGCTNRTADDQPPRGRCGQHSKGRK